MKVCGIYIITNLMNGMKYVGRSSNCKQRWVLHKYEARSKRRQLQELHKAIAQYGVENFKFEIFKEVSEELLPVAEREAMELLKTRWPNGYNVGSEFGGSSEGAYKRESILKNKREADPEFDKKYRALRGKAARARMKKEEANPDWYKECRKRASDTFRERMNNEEYRLKISSQRANAAKIGWANRKPRKEAQINAALS